MPIRIISEHSRHDQNVKKGHLHALHVWWATRPLAACRAVLLATLLPDPADGRCPEAFRQEAREILNTFIGQDLSSTLELRRALLKFIGYFAAWENASNRTFVETARKLVRAAHPEGPPMVVDPFAGIGSVPFEALRIGAEAFAGDLNPVAVLLNKVALEYLPTYGLKLAEAVRKWGKWVREQASEELKDFYPREQDGSIPLAYIWARTIRCEGPECGAEVPLVGLLWLSRKEKQRVALRYRGDKKGKLVTFEIFEPKSENAVQSPIAKRLSATCPVCGYTTPYKRVREQIRVKGGGIKDARMIAVITVMPNGKRGFRLAMPEDMAVARKASEELARRQARNMEPLPLVPDEAFPSWYSGVFNPGLWNIKTWGDLFSPRQALTLSTFAWLVRKAYEQVLEDTGDSSFARAVTTCLALAVSQLSHYLSSISFYGQEHMISAFIQGSGLPMRPDFAEANPLMPKLVGGFEYALEQVVQVLEREGEQGFRPGTIRQGSASALPLPDQSVAYVVTDPPYYAAVPYADLSDFCYVWLKRMVGNLYPGIFRLPLSPKDEEIIAYYKQPTEREPKDSGFFEEKMRDALAECRRVLKPGGLAVVLFAHKGTAGWEAMLNALLRAGWMVTASWPIETERGARMRAKNSAVLASSVFLVCRPRPENASVGEWRQVLMELNRRVAEWLPRLEQEGIHGADAIFSCLGPALEVYSRYERVETAGGQVIPLGGVDKDKNQIAKQGYLSYVWEAVAREALKVIFSEAEPTGFEADARLTAVWLWAIRARVNGGASEAAKELAMKEEETEEEAGQKKPPGYVLPYDDARLLIQALGVDEDMLKNCCIVETIKKSGQAIARLIPVGERRRFLLGKPSAGAPTPKPRKRQQLLFEEDRRVPEEGLTIEPRKSALDRLHQAMLLFAEGQSEALRRFLVEDGVGSDGRFWRLADALSRLYPIASQEKRWLDGVLARKMVLGL
ncbi:MAG: DUF1156 domain-containing protein [Coprothermobacterota bacterium]|nr:DUF1156 domain-containing protein [Coprothermobacterota bacterium]